MQAPLPQLTRTDALHWHNGHIRVEIAGKSHRQQGVFLPKHLGMISCCPALNRRAGSQKPIALSGIGIFIVAVVLE